MLHPYLATGAFLSLILPVLVATDTCTGVGIPGLPGVPGIPGRNGRDGEQGEKGEAGLFLHAFQHTQMSACTTQAISSNLQKKIYNMSEIP